MGTKPYRISNYVKDELEQQKINERRQMIAEGQKAVDESHQRTAADIVNQRIDNRRNREVRYENFVNEVYAKYLADAIYEIYNAAIDIEESSPVASESIKRNYVYSFIEENGGARKVLRTFKSRTNLLSEVSLIVEKSCKKAMKKVDKNDEDTFRADTEVHSEFMKELKDKIDSEEVGEIIKSRVSDSVNKFVEDNQKDKEEIEQIASDTQEKIGSTRKEKLQESYRVTAKRKIDEIKAGQNRTIYEAMVRSIAKAVVKEDYLRETFLDGDNINFDTVMESAIVMYTFFETVNTTKMATVDEAYIKDIYESLK